MRSASTPDGGAKVIGRSQLFREIASGGMGAVYLGKLVGEAGFQRTVAIKRLHPSSPKTVRS